MPRASRLRRTGLIRLNGELMAYGSKGKKAIGGKKRPVADAKMKKNKKKKGGKMTAKKMEVLRGKRRG